MDKEKMTKKISDSSLKETKLSLTQQERNYNEKKKNSQMKENPMAQNKATDNSTDSTKREMIHFPGKEHLNGAMALIIMPEVTVKEEQKQDKDTKISRLVSALSVASSSSSLDQRFLGTELKEENEDQNLTPHESTALFQTCIPYLPIEIAVICLIFNILLPGLGSILCGISNFCCGKMQETVKKEDVPMKVFINLLVGLMQLLTVTFLLVGWFWSIAWGMKILLLSIENQKRIKKQKILKERKKKAKFAFAYADDDDGDDDDHDFANTPKLKYKQKF